MSGVLRPGDFIRLDETAVELGVSVTPVREALLTLRGEGIAQEFQGIVESYVQRRWGAGA